MTVGVYLYNQIAGVWPKWTLAIWATSQHDADNRVKVCWHGGKRVGVAHPGEVQADCGDVTDAAQAEISEKHARFLEAP